MIGNKVSIEDAQKETGMNPKKGNRDKDRRKEMETKT